MWIAVLAGIAEVVVGLDVVVAVVLVVLVVVVVVVVEVVVVLTTAQAEVNTTVASIMAHRFVIPPQTSLASRGHLGPGCWWEEPYLSVASGLDYRLEDREP